MDSGWCDGLSNRSGEGRASFLTPQQSGPSKSPSNASSLPLERRDHRTSFTAFQKWATMKITPPPPSCTYFITTELPCAICSGPMKLTLIEPSGPNVELRTYECAPCDSGASFLMAI